jgi:hypothetical protein
MTMKQAATVIKKEIELVANINKIEIDGKISLEVSNGSADHDLF